MYVYDNSNNELTRFKDMKYAYTPMFCPKHNMFVVKSTEGNIAVYSLDKMQLIKKFRFSKINNSQDDGFCFSKDGKYFYNIERHINGSNSCLSIYETENFNRETELFLSENIKLHYIEYDDVRDGLFVLGFIRKEQFSGYGFAAALEDNRLLNITELTQERYEYVHGYKSLEIKDFTPKAKEWSTLSYQGYDLEKLEHVRLSDMVCSIA